MLHILHSPLLLLTDDEWAARVRPPRSKVDHQPRFAEADRVSPTVRRWRGPCSDSAYRPAP
jgi:hypothetical protein